MRELILKDIESFRAMEQGFNKNTMRWSKWYLYPRDGIVFISRKKDKCKYNNLIRLSDTTSKDFGELTDEVLLTTYVLIIKQMSKQM